MLKGEGETDAQRKGEEDLRAEAKKTFEEKVEPFVKQYCTRCHGGGRAKANVNLEVDLKAPGRGVAFVHWKGGGQCQGARHATRRCRQTTQRRGTAAIH